MTKNLLLLLLFVAVNCCIPANGSAQTGWLWGIGSVPGYTTIESGRGVTDSVGNVYASYQIEGSTALIGSTILNDSLGFFTLGITKADSSGNFLWSICTQDADIPTWDIASDASGNLYVCGVYYKDSTYVGTTLLTDSGQLFTVFLAKISPAGNVLWAQNICRPGDHYSNTFIGLDGADNVYVTSGFFTPSVTIGSTTLLNTNTAGGTADVFITKYASSGSFVWAKSFGGLDEESSQAMAVTKTGNIYISVVYDSAITIAGTTFTDSLVLLAKFDSSGTSAWAENIDSAINVSGMTTDVDENVYLCGAITGSFILGPDTLTRSGSYDFFVGKYDPLGNAVWGHNAKGKSWGYGISIDRCQHIWTCGTIYHTMRFGSDSVVFVAPLADQMFFAEYDTAGNYLKSMGFPAGGDDYSDMVTDNYGNLYLTCDYGATHLVVGRDTLPNSSSEDLLIAKFRYDTVICCYESPIPGFTSTGVSTVTFTYTGINGYDSLRWYFGDGATATVPDPVHVYTAPGIYTACVDVYSHCLPPDKPFVYTCRNINIPTGVTNINNADEVSIYPNPAQNELFITATDKITDVSINNALGQRVYNVQCNSKQTEVNLSNFTPGVYFVKINGSTVKRFVRD